MMRSMGMKVLLVIFLLAAKAACGAAEVVREGGVVGVFYYMPFSMDTYLAITEMNISGKNQKICNLSRPGAIQEIIGASSEIKGLYDKNRVRAKIEENGDSIFIDTNGIFIRNKTSRSINEDKLLKILNGYGRCQLPSRRSPG